MKSLNYFQLLCFFWAALGILSRIAMVVMGDRWRTWELSKVYTKAKPNWINVVGVLGYLMLTFTWYQVYVTNVPYSWVIATLMSLTLVKLSLFVFDYDTFYSFAVTALHNRTKMAWLNIAVLVLSVVFVMMGTVLY